MDVQQVHLFAAHALELRQQGKISDSIRAYRLFFGVAGEADRIENYGEFGKSLFLAKEFKEAMIAFQALMLQSAPHAKGSNTFDTSCVSAGLCFLNVLRQGKQLDTIVASTSITAQIIDSLNSHMVKSIKGDERSTPKWLLNSRLRLGDVFTSRVMSYAVREFKANRSNFMSLIDILVILGTYSVESVGRSLRTGNKQATCNNVETALGFKCLRQTRSDRLSATYKKIEEWPGFWKGTATAGQHDGPGGAPRAPQVRASVQDTRHSRSSTLNESEIQRLALHAVELKRQGKLEESIQAYRLVFAVADDEQRTKSYGGFGKSLFLVRRWQDALVAFQALMFQAAVHPGGTDLYHLSAIRAGTCLLQVYRDRAMLSQLVDSKVLTIRVIDAFVQHMADSFRERDDQDAFDKLMATEFQVADALSPMMLDHVVRVLRCPRNASLPLVFLMEIIGSFSVNEARMQLLKLHRNVSCDEVEEALGFKGRRQNTADGLQNSLRLIQQWRYS